MLSWRSRILAGLLLYAAYVIHELCTASLPNTPGGMLVFHGSAALADLLLLWVMPVLISDRLCDDMQTLCLVFIIVNFIGWLAYLAYAPPIFYNVVSWSLAYVQWGRLLLVDRDDTDPMGLHPVRGRNNGWSKLYP